MITRPTTSQLIGVIRAELEATVAPGLTDPAALGSLHMVSHLLSTLAVRAEHEIAWMVEEIAAIEALAARSADPSVAEAFSAFRSGRTGGLRASEVTADHDLASEVLSWILETSWSDEALHADVRALLATRLDHGVTVAGDFSLAAR